MEILVQSFVLLIICAMVLVLFYAPIVFGIIKLVQWIKEKQREFEEKQRQKREEYEKGAYFQTTHTSYNRRFFDKGKTGEYLIYECLKHRETNGAKFLFNVYVPKKNGSTSEVDTIMIDPYGIFVFESKNYSGWIFGDASNKQWCQCLRSGRSGSQKEYFYNPIMQNSGHIQSLRAYFAQYKISQNKIPMHNIVVFSDRCDLKNGLSSNSHITYRCRLNNKVQEVCNTQQPCLNQTQIEWIYKKLYPYTQVSDDVKSQHIQNINN